MRGIGSGIVGWQTMGSYMRDGSSIQKLKPDTLRRIGGRLIALLRTKVFALVQRMPIAFFTRTQTGALVSWLNSDVLGAQRAFTSTLSSVVSNLVSLLLTGITMFVLSWQITLLALILLPILD